MAKLRVDALSKFVGLDPSRPVSESRLRKAAKENIFAQGKREAPDGTQGDGTQREDRRLAEQGIACLLKNISFSLPHAGSISVMGDPGSGKTILVDLLGGFEKPTLGTIWLDDVKLTGLSGQRGMRLRRAAIRTASVQDRLFPHLSVRENLELAARLAGSGPPYREAAKELIALMELERVADVLPQKLTLHQTRRSLIAQSLTGHPGVLLIGGLLDGLSGSERDRMFEILADLRRQLQFSLLVTTEDAGIALGVGDEMIMLNRSEALQSGPALDVILEPADERVKEALAKAGLSDVMEAEALMQMPTVIQLGTTLTGVSPQSVSADGNGFCAVVDHEHKFIGLVSYADAGQAATRGGDLTNKIQKPVTVKSSEKIKVLGKHLLEQDLPVVILAEGQALRGMVNKKDLLKVP